MANARTTQQNPEIPSAWKNSIDFPNDARFLWHGYWFPQRTISSEYSHELGRLIGWDLPHLLERLVYWNSNSIVIVKEDHSLILSPGLFRIFESSCGTAILDRTLALKRVLSLILTQIEVGKLGSSLGQEWIFDVVNHWKTLHQIGGIPCKAEIEILENAASAQVKEEPLGRKRFSTQSFKSIAGSPRLRP